MNPARCVNDFQRNHLKYIKETGVSIMHVAEGQNPATPAWSYTVGLWHRYRHLEVIVIGLGSNLTQNFIEQSQYLSGMKDGRLRMGQLLLTF
jgi:hypothetical protein